MIAELQSAITPRENAPAFGEPMSSADRVKVKLERHVLLLRGAPVAIVVSAVNALITLWVAWNWLDRPTLILWTGMAVSLSLVRLVLWRRFSLARHSPHALLRFTQAHVGAMALNGVLWGALAPMFAFSGMLSNAYLPFIIAGMTAAAVSSAGASWKSVMAFNVPVLASMAASYGLAVEGAGATIAMIIVLYGVATGYLAWRMEQMIVRAIRLRSRNDALLKALTRQVDVAHESEKRFRALVESSTDLTLIFSPEGRVTYASPAVESALGYAPQMIHGRTTKEIVHPDDLGLFRSVGSKSLSKLGEVIPLGHVCMKRADGSYCSLGGRLTNMLYVPGVEGFAFSGGVLEHPPCRRPVPAE